MASDASTPGENRSNINFTKQELLDRIQKQEQEIQDLRDQLNQQAAVALSGKKGWMISTPNPAYTGRTAGVYIENGHAFIPADMPGARKLLGILTNDFGYSATETDNGQETRAPAPKSLTVAEAVTRPTVL